MKKSDVITVSEEFTTYKILGTEFEILQDNKDKEIFLETSDRTFCTYQPMTWSCRNYTEDYAFKRLNGTYVHLYNRKSNDYLTIVLNEDNSINIISHITDCLPDSEIQHISDSHFTLKGEKAQPWEPEQTVLKLVKEYDNHTEWYLGESGFYLKQYKDTKKIYLINETNLCFYQPKTFSTDNDWTANQPLKYAFAMKNEKCVLLHDMDKKDYLSMCLDEDNNIESVHNINDIFNTDVIEIAKDGYMLEYGTFVEFE